MFSLSLIAIVFSVGILIGGIGIGGVLLVPSLKSFGSVSLHVVIPACMISYIATGIIGAVIYAKHGTINWSLAAKICFGALPGAYIGSFLLPYLPALYLEIAIAVLIVLSGINSLIQTNKKMQQNYYRAL